MRDSFSAATAGASSAVPVSATDVKVRHCVRAIGSAHAEAIALLKNNFLIVLYLSKILFTDPPVYVYGIVLCAERNRILKHNYDLARQNAASSKIYTYIVPYIAV